MNVETRNTYFGVVTIATFEKDGKQYEVVSGPKCPVRHRSYTQGVVITDTETVEVYIDGELDRVEENRYWSDFNTGKLHHVDTVLA